MPVRNAIAVKVLAIIFLIGVMFLGISNKSISLTQAIRSAFSSHDSDGLYEIVLPPFPVVDGNQSTCSETATLRGPGQRVVAFSFYGSGASARPYLKGIEGNSEAVRRIYPGWIMRVYHDVNEDNNSSWSVLHALESKYRNLDLCNVSSLPAFGNITGSQQNAWRFLAMQDPLVDVFVSRDLDSRPSLREAAAVDDWLTANITFHVMRDHPYHSLEILAGMWGARMDFEREMVQKLGYKILKAAIRTGSEEQDQIVLRQVLWPTIKGNVLQHDSYSCTKFSSHGNMKAWPTRRRKSFYNFVGFRDQVDTNPINNTCPEVCRPYEHEDWVTC